MARTEVSFVPFADSPARRTPPARRPVAAAVAATLGVLLLHWPSAHAMTLGVPRVNSALGQPLDLMIPAQSENPNELSGECLRLLPAPDSDIPTLTAGRILVERDGLLTTLRIRSLDPINEPAFRVVLEAGCQRRMQREYVLLLDPPPLRDRVPAVAGTGAVAEPPVVVPGAPTPANVIELGEAEIRAVRGRPLLMRVPVRGPGAAQLTAECVRTVADDRLPTLRNTSVRLLNAGTPGVALEIVSRDLLTDQVVRLVAEVGCERPIRRQFDVLVETPSPIYENLEAASAGAATAPVQPKPAVPRAVRPRPTPAPVAPTRVAPVAPPVASKAPPEPGPAAVAPAAPPPAPVTTPAPDRLVLAAPEEAPAATPSAPTPAPTQTDELVKRLDELATEVKRLRTELDAANARNAALNEKLASAGNINLGWAVAAGVSILFAGLLWMSNRRPRRRRERADDHDVEGPMTRIVGRRTQAASHDAAAHAASAAAAAATVAGAGTHLATNLTDVRSHHDIQVTEMGDEEAIRELYSGYVSKQSSPSTVMRGDLQLPAAGRGEYGTRFGDETGATRMTMPLTTQIAVDIDLSQDDGYGMPSPPPPGQTVTRPLELDLELDLPLDESLTRGKADKGGKAD